MFHKEGTILLLKNADMIPNKNKSAAALYLSFLFSLGAAFVRCIQLLMYTNPDTGIVIDGAENTVALFYIFTALSVVMLGAFVFASKSSFECPIQIKDSTGLSLCSCLAAAGMFYDFVHQCVRCYLYVSANSYIAVNRLLPMIFSAVFALLSAVFFIFTALSVKSSRYDFSRMWFFKITPVLWSLVNLLILLTDYDDDILAIDTLLKYSAFILALVFFVLFALTAESEKANGSLTVFFGFLYSGISFSLSFGRMVCFIIGQDIVSADFSSPAFMFTGLFAFAFSFCICLRKKV